MPFVFVDTEKEVSVHLCPRYLDIVLLLKENQMICALPQ